MNLLRSSANDGERRPSPEDTVFARISLLAGWLDAVMAKRRDGEKGPLIEEGIPGIRYSIMRGGFCLSIFEIIMLICFGAAWPFSIYKSYKSRSTHGKSATFLVIILIGYASGILNKIYYHFDNVVYLYALNMIMVALDLMFYLRNQRYKVSEK